MKKLMNRIIPTMLMLASGIMLMTCLNSCKQDHLTLTTTSDVNMYSYLQQDNQFSLFRQIVDKAGYASFLNTYGTYTLFAPNNEGVTAYLKATGKASVDDIDATTAKGLVGISLIADTLGTQYFSDGKLRSPSTLGQYLITSAVNTGGVTNIVINKQANLVQGNIRVGNGIIHIIDNVLVPAPYTLAETIDKNPKLTIFSAALKATGLYDQLNYALGSNPDTTHKYLTVIAESDSVLTAAGYGSLAALKARYSTKGDPTNHADSLWLFMAYHVWPELSYLSDIALLTSHATLAPLEITTSELDGTTILLNNDTFNGVLEPGQQLDRPNSDISASNGVLHTVLGHYSIKIRFPSPVYYDVCAQPEIIRTPGLYRVGGGKSQQFKQGTLANVIETGRTSGVGAYVVYYNDKTPPSNYFYGNDYMDVGDRFRATGAEAVEYITPVIVRGKYKIWVDYLRQSTAQVVPAYYSEDGITYQPLPNTFNTGDALNAAETPAQALNRGFKSYSDAPLVDGTTNPYYGNVGRLLGIVDVKTTDHKRIKFTTTAVSSAAAHLIVDVIEFRPADMDQLKPQLGHNGDLVY